MSRKAIALRSGIGQPGLAVPKHFKTGSRGFYGQGKMEIDGRRYQAQIQMVEIGSKERAKSEA
jgi:hypothetical protein